MLVVHDEARVTHAAALRSEEGAVMKTNKTRGGMSPADRDAWNNRPVEVTVKVLCPHCVKMAKVIKTKCADCFTELPKHLVSC